MTPHTTPQSSRVTKEVQIQQGGWCRRWGGTAVRSAMCREEVSLRTNAGCSSIRQNSSLKRLLPGQMGHHRDLHPASFLFSPFTSFRAPLQLHPHKVFFLKSFTLLGTKHVYALFRHMIDLSRTDSATLTRCAVIDFYNTTKFLEPLHSSSFFLLMSHPLNVVHIPHKS